MRKSFVFVFLCLLGANAHSELKGSPFLPEVDQRFHEVVGDSAFHARSGLKAKQIAVAVYDFDVHGGTSAVGVFDTGVDLPANALITRSWIYVSQAVTSTVDTGNNAELFSFVCTSNAADETLLTALNLSRRTPADEYAVEAAATGASTVFNEIATACDVKAKVTQADLTDGKVTLYVEYVLHAN